MMKMILLLTLSLLLVSPRSPPGKSRIPFLGGFHSFTKKKKDNKRGGGDEKAATIKLRNERGMICISAHPEAENLEEQHHNAQHAHTPFCLLCIGCSLNNGDQILNLA
jgi:hypothetical protein